MIRSSHPKLVTALIEEDARELAALRSNTMVPLCFGCSVLLHLVRQRNEIVVPLAEKEVIEQAGQILQAPMADTSLRRKTFDPLPNGEKRNVTAPRPGDKAPSAIRQINNPESHPR